MGKETVPAEGPDGIAFARLTDRVDGLASRGVKTAESLARHEARLKLLDEGFIHLNKKVKELGESGPPPAEELEDAEEEEEEEEEEERERDWLRVVEGMEAQKWLQELYEWLEHTFRYLAPRYKIQACWPWHPFAVEELLALQAHRELAYTSGAAAVSDFRTRWLPATLDRLNGRDPSGELTQCMGLHVDARGKKWQVDPTKVDDYARWWAESKDPATEPGLTKVN